MMKADPGTREAAALQWDLLFEERLDALADLQESIPYYFKTKMMADGSKGRAIYKAENYLKEGVWQTVIDHKRSIAKEQLLPSVATAKTSIRQQEILAALSS
jgi:hypothetical protein